MIITTVYTERLTITTADNGSITTERTHSADTHTAYLFEELSEAAQARAISDAIEDEKKEYYSYGEGQSGIAEREILSCAQDLEKAQPIEIAQDYGCSWYGTARGANWYPHPANWEAVTEQQDNGWCYSMDICDMWNTYAARIIALQEGHEEAEDRAAEFYGVYSDATDEAWSAETEEERQQLEALAEVADEANDAFNKLAERIEEAAEELTEEAARAVGNVIDGLIESEHEYYTSDEFWRDWYANGDERFTRDGERI